MDYNNQKLSNLKPSIVNHMESNSKEAKAQINSGLRGETHGQKLRSWSYS